MSLFDQIWRKVANPVLDRHFSETAQATYYDGAGTERGTYNVLLAPEELVEKDEDSGRRTRYQRVATLTWTDASPFTEPTIAATGYLVIGSVNYAIASVLSKSGSAAVLVLQRGGRQREMADG